MTEQIAASQRAIPPPLDLDLIDGDRRVGWLTRETVGFAGFANEVEAMHAAWVAHRTLARRLSRAEGRRPVPIDTEPLALRSDDGIHASGRRIAALVRPGAASMSGADSYGFELTFRSSLDELSARANAHLIYRALRRSGVRWAMWLPDAWRMQSSAAVTRAATSEAALPNAWLSRLVTMMRAGWTPRLPAGSAES